MGFVPNACGSGRPSREAFPRFSVFWGVLCRIKIFIPCALCKTWLQRRPGLAFSSWESSRPRPRVSRGRSPLPGPALISRALRWFARPALARARLAPVAFGSRSSASGPFLPARSGHVGGGGVARFHLGPIRQPLASFINIREEFPPPPSSAAGVGISFSSFSSFCPLGLNISLALPP